MMVMLIYFTTTTYIKNKQKQRRDHFWLHVIFV